MNPLLRWLGQMAALCGSAMFIVANAQSTSDVASTPHNLSVDGPGTAKATSETQVCVFCHTPHGATNSPGTPLWNRSLSGQTYTTYSSSSLDAATIAGQLETLPVLPRRYACYQFRQCAGRAD